jgi:hypothetical protein
LPLLAPPLHMEEPKNSSNNCNCVVRRCKWSVGLKNLQDLNCSDYEFIQKLIMKSVGLSCDIFSFSWMLSFESQTLQLITFRVVEPNKFWLLPVPFTLIVSFTLLFFWNKHNYTWGLLKHSIAWKAFFVCSAEECWCTKNHRLPPSHKNIAHI